MAEYGFPGTAAHLTEHDKFTQAVAKFLADHRAGKPGVPVSLDAVPAEPAEGTHPDHGQGRQRLS